MPKKTLRIAGRVIDRNSKTGIPGLRVESWDKEFVVRDLVGSAVTDTEGSFKIEFEDTRYKELFADR